MMKQTILISILLLTACGQNTKTNDQDTVNDLYDTSTQTHPPATLETNSADTKIDKALTFINGYVAHGNDMNQGMDNVTWVNSNNLATKSFKAELKRIIDDAYKADPEMGLDFDPILDAQDYPDKGFELESFDEQTNYVTVKGIDWPDFKLTMKLIEENGDWLVDGCGIINIPTNKRAER